MKSLDNGKGRRSERGQGQCCRNVKTKRKRKKTRREREKR